MGARRNQSHWWVGRGKLSLALAWPWPGRRPLRYGRSARAHAPVRVDTPACLASWRSWREKDGGGERKQAGQGRQRLWSGGSIVAYCTPPGASAIHTMGKQTTPYRVCALLLTSQTAILFAGPSELSCLTRFALPQQHSRGMGLWGETQSHGIDDRKRVISTCVCRCEKERTLRRNKGAPRPARAAGLASFTVGNAFRRWACRP